MKLRTKLLVMVAVPLAGLLWVSVWNSLEMLFLSREMGQLQQLVVVSTRMGGLVHELQKERGMSAGFIGSKGVNFAKELPAQRQSSDQARQALQDMLAGFDTRHYGNTLVAKVDAANRQLTELAAMRQSVTALSVAAPDSTAYYTRTIAALLAVAGQLPTLSSDNEIVRLAATYSAFIQAKERAGIERATLTNALSADHFEPAVFLKFIRNAAEQDTWFALFEQSATEAQKSFAADKIKGPAVDEVAATKQAAIAKVNAESLGLNAKQWFAAATARIDLMKEVETYLESAMTSAMADIKHHSTLIAWFYALASLLAVVLVFGVMHKITRSILAQIGGEPLDALAVAHSVAEGRFDHAIHLKDGDNSSLLASMRRMQENLRVAIERDRKVAMENLGIRIALDNVSTGVMIADTDRKIIYVNPAVQRILKRAEADIRSQLPNFSADQLLGSNIDLFHKNPPHQAQLLAGLRETHSADLLIGGSSLTVSANPVINGHGERLGSVAEWRDRTAEIATQKEIEAIVAAAVAGDFSLRLGDQGKTGFFLNLVRGINQLMDITSSGLSDVASVLQAVAQGDLTRTINAEYRGTFGQLKDDTNQTVARLRDVVGRIKEASDAIHVAAQEIAAGNHDLSGRTEEQAGSLEETASSMEELTSTVKQNAENAQQANQLTTAANKGVTHGGEVVRQVVGTMREIQSSSRKIADIIGVIDSIAFQTNILALNAAVEAARAGEQGRGFAVVATEVRNLAQRSATAAKEIKALIAESVSKVENGAKLVSDAGATMDGVVTSFRQIAELVTEISNASQEQSTGIEQVTKAVGQMDEVTQQNAALVEQAAAAAESLEEQTQGLAMAVAIFKLSDEGQRHDEQRHLPGPALRDITPKRLR